ncbi:MFS transporter [Ningiella sp. W23]|uniref:MFS transporter n=1 Tax=Ningiella sp. W23 TaxID=3023715 RepID=UPI0037584DFC
MAFVESKTKLAYGAGDFALAIVVYGVQLFLLYYYTDVIGLSAVSAGVVFFVGIVFDILTDPIVGYRLQKLKARSGEYRRYLLIAALPLALANIGLYAYPQSLGELNLFYYVVIFHLLFRAVFTLVSISFYSLVASITKNSDKRSSLVGFSLFGSACGALLVALFTLQTVEFLGHENEQLGFIYTNCVLSVVALSMLLLTYRFTHENNAEVLSHELSLRQAINVVKRNSALLYLSAAMLSAFVGTYVFVQMIIYFCKYVIEMESIITPALSWYLGISLVGIPVWIHLSKRYEKHINWFIGACLFAMSALTLCIVSVFDWYTGSTAAGITLILISICGLGASAISFAFWSMLPDTIEFGQSESSKRLEGFTYGMASFFIKLTYSLAAGLIGLLLAWSEFTANALQTSKTLYSMTVYFTLIPAIFVALSTWFLKQYPITKHTHQRLVHSLEPKLNKQT